MTLAIVLIAALLLLVGLIRAEKSERAGRILVFKTPLSLLFIVAWTLSPARHPLFAGMILVALWLCLAGDVLLAFGSQGTFLAGLISFLAGHAVYAAAFFTVGTTGTWMGMAVIVLIAAGLVIWRWLAPHLDDMQAPVLAYIVVISMMVIGAASLAGTASIPVTARISVLAGAVLFYLSDICVARQRFVVSAPVNRLAGLPLYYAAQFLLAVSAAWIPASRIIAS
jgi:uncharacterized membrane protein YhhN